MATGEGVTAEQRAKIEQIGVENEVVQFANEPIPEEFIRKVYQLVEAPFGDEFFLRNAPSVYDRYFPTGRRWIYQGNPTGLIDLGNHDVTLFHANMLSKGISGMVPLRNLPACVITGRTFVNDDVAVCIVDPLGNDYYANIEYFFSHFDTEERLTRQRIERLSRRTMQRQPSTRDLRSQLNFTPGMLEFPLRTFVISFWQVNEDFFPGSAHEPRTKRTRDIHEDAFQGSAAANLTFGGFSNTKKRRNEKRRTHRRFRRGKRSF